MQAELEKFDNVASGKYTIGLGQTQMGFCDDREDMYSMSLTVVENLLEKYQIDVSSIGRLEVGTETILDKSKSVKSVLMQLLGTNTDVEGADTVNACYGGTNALFNAINWVESSSWDGRKAIVVAGDIAIYAKGPARPTGGAGAVALLIGPDAPIVFEPGLRGSFMMHAYDFYKPDLRSEYPVVDGQFSVSCYTRALDAAYSAYQKKRFARSDITDGLSGAQSFDHMIFHAPTGKQVQKSYARLFYNDFLGDPDNVLFKDVRAAIADVDYETSLKDKNVEKAMMDLSKKMFAERVKPGLHASTMVGNMYCASLYSCLASLLSNHDPQSLRGKRVGAFSYGSGLASTFFSFKIEGDVSQIAKNLDLQNKLDRRSILEPIAYNETMLLREKAHLQKDYLPSGDISRIAPGTYYLTKIDEHFKREYERKDRPSS